MMADKKTGNQNDDDALWQHVASGVAPLNKRHKNLASGKAEPPPPAAPAGKAAPKKRTHQTAAPPLPAKKPMTPDLTHDAQPGLDKASVKKMKQGKLAIEARVDLHGTTQEQAHRALDSFIDGAQGAGRRAVLVITGKGLKTDGSVGVIRQMVPKWLNQQPNRGRILGFSHAAPKDGGTGALYVMIKRKR